MLSVRLSLGTRISLQSEQKSIVALIKSQTYAVASSRAAMPQQRVGGSAYIPLDIAYVPSWKKKLRSMANNLGFKWQISD